MSSSSCCESCFLNGIKHKQFCVLKLILFMDFSSRNNKSHGLGSKFCQSHGKLQPRTEIYKKKSKYKTHIHIETIK